MSDPLHIPYAELVVTNRDESMTLNKSLLDRQNCWQNLDLIKSLHMERMELEHVMELVSNPSHLKELFQIWTDIQFDLQEAWGFPRSKDHHMFWTVPRCTCPVLDNRDSYPSGYYYIASKCPIHGN